MKMDVFNINKNIENIIRKHGIARLRYNVKNIKLINIIIYCFHLMTERSEVIINIIKLITVKRKYTPNTEKDINLFNELILDVLILSYLIIL